MTSEQAFQFLHEEVLTHQHFRATPMTQPQHDLALQMITDLQRLQWNERESLAYLTAQRTHGVLSPSATTWEVKAALASWRVDKPRRTLTPTAAARSARANEPSNSRDSRSGSRQAETHTDRPDTKR